MFLLTYYDYYYYLFIYLAHTAALISDSGPRPGTRRSCKTIDTGPVCQCHPSLHWYQITLDGDRDNLSSLRSHSTAHRLGLNLQSLQTQVLRPNHCATEPRESVCKIITNT